MRLALFSLCCFLITESAIAQDKLPIPDAAARDKAGKLIAEIYGDEIDQAASA